jgi:hypothetical protein
MDSRSAKWIASDTIRELTSKAVQERIRLDGIATLLATPSARNFGSLQ